MDKRTEGVGWLLGVVAGAVIVGLVLASSGDRAPKRSTPDRVLMGCPDYLEVAGPYRRGIDPAYDRAMDWDGDGVSCE